MSAVITRLLKVQEDFLDIHVELTPEQAVEWAGRCPDYNGFDPAKVQRFIRAVNKLVPPMRFGPDNPNTGKPHHKWVVGREGSMVLYLKVIPTYLPTEFDYDELEGQLKALGEVAEADEFHYYRPDLSVRQWDLSVRFWWD